jgi:hypothetical protein
VSNDRSRPYARIRGTEPSVTTVIDAMLGKPGLPFAAARETALYVVEHGVPESPEPVGDLTRVFRGLWDGRAAMGTLVHKVNEEWSADRNADVALLVKDMAEQDTKARSWRGREDEVTDIALGYIDGLEAAWDELSPSVRGTETVVRQPGQWIGTADWRIDWQGRDALVDLKTTNQRNQDKGLYPDSWTLQLAALSWAAECVEYEWDDDGKPHEKASQEWHPPEVTLIVHLRGHGHHDLYEVPGAEREWGTRFGHLAEAYRSLRELKATRVSKESNDGI